MFFWKWPCKGRWTRCVTSHMWQGLDLTLRSASKDCACVTSQYNIPTIWQHIYIFLNSWNFLISSKGPWILQLDVQSPVWTLKWEFCLEMWIFWVWFSVFCSFSSGFVLSFFFFCCFHPGTFWISYHKLLPVSFQINLLQYCTCFLSFYEDTHLWFAALEEPTVGICNGCSAHTKP